jgi:ABC-2 type transport system permease protein
MGISLPANFDEQLQSDTPAALTAYVYGESLMSDRIILGLALVNSIRAVTGQESPVTISTRNYR